MGIHFVALGARRAMNGFDAFNLRVFATTRMALRGR